MIIAPITFPWVDTGPYAWTPKRERDGSEDYWNWAWDHLQWAGCNACVMLMGSKDVWMERNRTLAAVLHERQIPIMPYFAQASFTMYGWPPRLPNDPAAVGTVMARLVADIGKFTHLRDGWGNKVWAYLGNSLGDDEWDRYFLRRVNPNASWFIDRHSATRLDHDEQINLFTQPGYSWITGKTAAIRPGFLHGARPADHRFIARNRGKPWRRAWHRVIAANPDFAFIESEGEYMEGTSILPCSTRQNEPSRSEYPDTYGVGPRRYLKFMRQKLRR